MTEHEMLEMLQRCMEIKVRYKSHDPDPFVGIYFNGKLIDECRIESSQNED